MAIQNTQSRTPQADQKRVTLEDEPADLIESNDPDRGSSPVDPERPSVDPIGSIHPEQPDNSSDDDASEIESNDPEDPRNPLNQIREPDSTDDSTEGDPAIRDPERQPGENSRKIL